MEGLWESGEAKQGWNCGHWPQDQNKSENYKVVWKSTREAEGSFPVGSAAKSGIWTFPKPFQEQRQVSISPESFWPPHKDKNLKNVLLGIASFCIYDIYLKYLDYGDGFSGTYMCQHFNKLYALHICGLLSVNCISIKLFLKDLQLVSNKSLGQCRQ